MQAYFRFLAPPFAVFAAAPVLADETPPNVIECELTAFGAIADDGVDDTTALQAALDECAAQGRQVTIPAGRFDIGHIRLPSGTDLYLSPDAALVGSTRFADYPAIPGTDGHRAWFFADDARNIRISGSGTLDGAAAPIYKLMDEIIAKDRNDPRADERVRFGILLRRCDNVRIRDIQMRDTQMYFMNVNDCDNVVIDGVDLRAPIDSHNTDGIQITDSRDVRIANCRIAVGDDAIVTKARMKPVERLMVNNCVITSDDGAIKFGTRSASAVRDSQFSNIAITDSRYGIALFMINGGEYTNNRFSNITIRTGGRHPRTYPIFVDIDDRVEDPAARQLGVIDGLTFDGLDIRTSGNLLIAGHPDAPIRNLALSDVSITSRDGETIKATDTKPRGNRKFEPVPGSPDLAPIDATLVLGHVDGLTLDNVRVAGDGNAGFVHSVDIRNPGGSTVDLLNLPQ
jgi:polygalacturonase